MCGTALHCGLSEGEGSSFLFRATSLKLHNHSVASRASKSPFSSLSLELCIGLVKELFDRRAVCRVGGVERGSGEATGPLRDLKDRG